MGVSQSRSIDARVQYSINGKVQPAILLTEDAGLGITEDLTVRQMKVAIERLSAVHQNTQKFIFGGRQMQNDDNIFEFLGLSSEKLDQGKKNTITLNMVVDKVFPAMLGPFRVQRVPLISEDFEVTEMNPDMSSAWTIKKEVLERYVLKAKGPVLMGQASPSHRITLDQDARQAASIPEEAAYFQFSYPVVDWESLETGDICEADWQDISSIQAGKDLVQSFLSEGGYMYRDEQGSFLSCATLGMMRDEDIGGLRFRAPQRWDPAWTETLWQQGRFQSISLKCLRDEGARKFCWLGPGEKLRSADGQYLERQPIAPHGGFVYLFHEDELSGNEGELCLDRYFAVADSKAVVAKQQLSKNVPGGKSNEQDGPSLAADNTDTASTGGYEDFAPVPSSP